MANLIKTWQAPTLKDRLAKIKAPAGSVAHRVAQQLHANAQSKQCLLLDVSGSMAENCGDGRAKIAALIEIVRDFPGTRQFSFASSCAECAPSVAGGSTDMALAFHTIKQNSITHAVLITDGVPDSVSKALDAASGLKIDIVYVGPPPEPPFLALLAQLTGGQYGAGNLAQQKQLAQRLTLLLEDKR